MKCIQYWIISILTHTIELTITLFLLIFNFFNILNEIKTKSFKIHYLSFNQTSKMFILKVIVKVDQDTTTS